MRVDLVGRWRAVNMVDGTAFYPPEGSDIASICVRERIAPLEPVRNVIARIERSLAPTMNLETTSAIEMFETTEPESGALVKLAGVSKTTGVRLEYIVALVFGDDFYDRIDAYFAASDKKREYQALVHDFILGHRLNLGTNRERRFYYVPPSGWQGRARGLVAQWFTYDFPKRPSNILVSPARPTGLATASVMATVMVHGRLAAIERESEHTETLTTTDGLEAYLHHVHGRFPTSRITDLLSAALTDGKYIYAVRLETTEQWLEADRAVLLDVARSIRRVPHSDLEIKQLSWLVID